MSKIVLEKGHKNTNADSEELNNIELVNLVVHYLHKKQESDPSVKLSDKCLPINELSIKFIKKVKDRYYKCNPIYGTFNEDQQVYPYQTLVDEYLKEGLSFIDYTTSSMKLLEKSIKNTGGTGGYMLFAHYKILKDEFVCVIMLHNTIGFNINSSLELEELTNLDIEKLDIANFINVDKWRSATSEDSYLSFLSGRKNVTEYFKDFIGCTNQKSSTIASKAFYKALESFLTKEDLDVNEKIKLKNTVFEYCSTRIHNKEDIKLSAVSSLLNPDDANKFKIYASKEEFQVSAVFRGSRDVLKNLKYVNYKSDDLSIQLNKKLINDTVHYNEEANELLITKIPSDLRELLKNN
ncbi:nucleoid-associated protein [Marinifilum fragile]|uniref:nucleoid-associated protein n=1 Tax=Marinifilum fragile TaxID=570161 RepID=UPI0006D0548A|nr:nucleoid-associated protein [Marinifilum fragile]